MLSSWYAHAQVPTPAGATFGSVVNLGGTPSDIVLDELRGRLYLVIAAADRVDIYSIPDKRVTASIRVGTYPLAAAMSMDGGYLYVTNTQSASLSVIDLAADALVQTVSLPARPEGVAVGIDGRAVISTQGSGVNNGQNQLLIFDRTAQSFQQVTPVLFPPAITTPNPLPAVFVGRPATPFPGRLIRTPDGNFIAGMVAINQTANTALTTLFVYEVLSGVVLRNRTVTGQSTVLSMAPDGSRFMAGSTLYDFSTLQVLGQMSSSNLPFFISTQGVNPAFNIQQNYGGSVFSPGGDALFSAFNFANLNQRPQANILLITNTRNLGARLGIKIPESILSRMVTTESGSDVFGLSESGLVHLPVSTLYDYPILQPETTQVFVAVDDCNKGIAKTEVRVSNLGKGKLSYAVPITTTAVVTQVSSGLAPSTITFTMEPGRSGVVRQPGTNLFTNAAGGAGAPINVTLATNDAINIPNAIRVYMNFRQSDQRGQIFPIPTALNNNEGLQDMVLDEPRGLAYISNSGYNRVEVFDINKRRLLNPIEVGQLPRSLAMTPDGGTLYVGNSGGESITIVDLDLRRPVGEVEFPPIPRAGNQVSIRPFAMAFGLSGLQFIMSNGAFWRVIGNTATPRAANNVTPATITAPQSMIATSGGEYILTLAGNGNAYLYNSLADTYTAARLLYNQAPISYFGVLGGGPAGSYFLAGGMILSPSLALIGGSERPGVTQVGPPPAPGQPPTQTVVSAGQRNVANVTPLNDYTFLRTTTPVRNNATATTRDDARAIIEMVDIRNGAETVAAIAPENPAFSVFGTQRVNIPPRQLAVDSRGNTYSLTVSGLSVVPVASAQTSRRPVLNARGIVNSNDGTQNYRPGSFITINGSNLAAASIADSIPLPTVLGGSCAVINEMPMPLLSTSDGQISAQLPDNMRPGVAIVQVRSLANAVQSDPVVVTVQK